MSRWTICFDATITASVEANTAKEAVEAAERALDTIGIDGLQFGDATQCSIGKILVIRDEQTGVEIRK